MKGAIVILGVLAVLVLASVGASAITTTKQTTLTYKDPVTWQPVGNAYGFFTARVLYPKPEQYNGYYVLSDDEQPTNGVWTWNCYVRGVPANSEFVIVNYHEEWPYADVVGVATSDYRGTFMAHGMLPGEPFGKIWIVPEEDFDVDTGMFLYWNPTEILFENTVFV